MEEWCNLCGHGTYNKFTFSETRTFFRWTYTWSVCTGIAVAAIYAYYVALRWMTFNLVIFFHLDGQEGNLNLYSCRTDVAFNDGYHYSN